MHFLHSLPIILMAYLFVISNNNVLFGSIFILVRALTHIHTYKYITRIYIYIVYLYTSINRTITHLVFFFNIK